MGVAAASAIEFDTLGPGDYDRAKKILNRARHPGFVGRELFFRCASGGQAVVARIGADDYGVALAAKGKLQALSVVREAQGKGVGSALMARCAPKFVSAIMDKVPWFERLGYRCVGTPRVGQNGKQAVQLLELSGDRVAAPASSGSTPASVAAAPIPDSPQPPKEPWRAPWSDLMDRDDALDDAPISTLAIASPEISLSLSDESPLHIPAWKFYQDPARFCLAVAGRRGAKSYTGAKKFWKKVWEEDWPVWSKLPYNPGVSRRRKSLWWARRPRMHYWVVADTYQLLEEPRRYLLQFLPDQLIEHFDPSKNQLWLRGDILIEFKTVHDPEGKVGSGLNGIWIEEAARVRSDAWSLYLFAALGDRRGWAILTTTPLGKDWTFEAIEEPARKGLPEYGAHSWRSVDNIRAPHVIELAAVAKRDLPAEHYEREFEANRQAFIGQIYKSFKAGKHVFDELPDTVRFQRVLGGADWGTSNPGCLLTAGITGGDRPHIYVRDEVYSSSMLVEDFWAPEAQKLNKKRGFNDWVGDPAEPDNIIRMQNAKVNMAKHANFVSGNWDEHARSIMAGIRTMSSLIHQNRFHVHRSCVNLIGELENYVWDRTSAGLQLDKPKPHQKDHAVTTARYIVTTAVEGPMLQAVA